MMEKRTICSLTCPMLNAQGFCESAWRRVEQIRECPHDRLRRAAASVTSEKETKGHGKM